MDPARQMSRRARRGADRAWSEVGIGPRECVVTVKALVIHVSRASGRRLQVERLRRSLPLAVEVIDAVDGLRLSDADIRRVVVSGLHRPRYPFVLSRTEAACFLSHRKAWQAILDDGLDAGLVIEDDAAIVAPEFAAVLGAAVAGLELDEFVRFPHRERNESGPVVRLRGPARFLEPRLPALGMVMQLVGREAARKLLDASRTFDRPVDSFVQMHWLHTARVLTVRPIVIREICGKLGGSMIHPPHTGIAHKIIREVRRPLIRLAVYRESNRRRRAA